METVSSYVMDSISVSYSNSTVPLHLEHVNFLLYVIFIRLKGLSGQFALDEKDSYA